LVHTCGETDTFAVHVVSPPGPLTFIVKVVEFVAVTLCEPDSLAETHGPAVSQFVPSEIAMSVAAVVVHDSVAVPPPTPKEDGATERVHTGGGGGTGGAGGGGGGGGGGGVGTTQQGVPITCANTCEGVTNPVANAMDMPMSTVKRTAKRPTKIGRLLTYRYAVCVFDIGL
jgi:hypothetical protein